MLLATTLTSAIASFALAFVVFGPGGWRLGLLDDALFILAALVFLYTFVRVIGDRIAATVQEDHVMSPGDPGDPAPR